MRYQWRMSLPGALHHRRARMDSGLRLHCVVDGEGRPWVAPDLVLHYVVEHGYDPGFKFRDAPEVLVNFLRNRVPAPILNPSLPI